MQLPESYQKKIKALFKEDYSSYFDSFQQPPYQGIRINTSKISVEDFIKLSPFQLEAIPWCKNGFYVNKEEQVSKHPYYYAGLYYIQEPSAMYPASALPIEKGDFVLDTCAAPGGKSTELAAKLDGTGFLLSNDISHSRCLALLKNIERFGFKNTYVSSEDLIQLSKKLPHFFDKILIDAPCSGEGMFRKDSSLIKSWMERDSSYYVPIQKEILKAASTLLKPGGQILYSTCTFSQEENEQVIQSLLEQDPSFSLEQLPRYPGFQSGINLSECVRLYPHKIKGEGHFAALLKKEGESLPNQIKKKVNRPSNKECCEFLQLLNYKWENGSFVEKKDCIYFIPNLPKEFDKIRLVRSGLLLGEIKKNRFEPSQALASSLKASEFKQYISLSCKDERVIKYLKGETIDVSEIDQKLKGWILLCVDGFSLGFGKINHGIIKNKYKKGWRWQ